MVILVRLTPSRSLSRAGITKQNHRRALYGDFAIGIGYKRLLNEPSKAQRSWFFVDIYALVLVLLKSFDFGF